MGGSPAPCSTAVVGVISVPSGFLVPVGLLGASRLAPRRWYRTGEGEHIAGIVFRDPVVVMSVTLQLGGQSGVSLAESRMRWWTDSAGSDAGMTSR